MTNLTTGVITRMREILNEHPEIHQIPGNKARIHAIEDDVVDVRLETVEIWAQEGIVYVNNKEMTLIKYEGGNITLSKHDNWKEFIDGGLRNN